MKNLAYDENNFSDVHEELYWPPPVYGKHFPQNIFLEHLLQPLYSVDESEHALGCNEMFSAALVLLMLKHLRLF